MGGGKWAQSSLRVLAPLLCRWVCSITNTGRKPAQMTCARHRKFRWREHGVIKNVPGAQKPSSAPGQQRPCPQSRSRVRLQGQCRPGPRRCGVSSFHGHGAAVGCGFVTVPLPSQEPTRTRGLTVAFFGTLSPGLPQRRSALGSCLCHVGPGGASGRFTGRLGLQVRAGARASLGPPRWLDPPHPTACRGRMASPHGSPDPPGASGPVHRLRDRLGAQAEELERPGSAWLI